MTDLFIDDPAADDKPLEAVDVRALFAAHSITGPVKVVYDWGDGRVQSEILTVEELAARAGRAQPEPVYEDEAPAFTARTDEIPEVQKFNAAAPSCGPPSFDVDAIAEYVRMRHVLAAGLTGKFLVIVLTPEQKVRWIGHFAVGETERMFRSIIAFCPAIGTWSVMRGFEPLNLYCPWALFHPNIPAKGKGSGGREMDVIWSFAAVGDVDCDKRAETPLPFAPSCRLETSPGNFQDFFVYPQPITFAHAKVTLAALNRMTGNDDAEKDASHIWRIPGTLNYPTQAKIARGRSPVPWLVRWAQYPGPLVYPQTIIQAAPPEPPKVRRVSAPLPPDLNDFEVAKLVGALEVLHPDCLPKVEPPTCLYYYWLWVCMGIHSLGWGDTGLAIADNWSQQSRYYDPAELEAKYDSFDSERETKRSVGSIFMWAKGEGWQTPSPNREVFLDEGREECFETVCECEDFKECEQKEELS